LIRRPAAQTLKYDVAVLDERWSLQVCFGRETSRVRRHGQGSEVDAREREKTPKSDQKRADNQDQEIVGPSR